MEIAVALAIGYIAGVVVMAIVYTIVSASGTLKIDHTNPEKDIYRFVIDDLDKLNKKKYIRITIDHHADLSHK